MKKKPASQMAGKSDPHKLVHELHVHQHELEAMKRELAVSEERAKRAIEAAGMAIWDYDMTTGRVYLSEAWSTFLGGEPKPTVTTMQELIDLVPEAEQQKVKDSLAKAANVDSNSICSVTHRVRKKDGSYIWILDEGKIVERDEDGRPLRMIGANRDITERMELENELRKREARYRAVIDTSHDGFWMVNSEGRLLEVNDAYVRFSGYSREELLSMRVADLEAGETPEEVAAHVEMVRREGHDRFEAEHRRKDGTICPVEIEVTFWPAFDLAFVFVTDISVRKKLEKEVSERRKEMDELQKRQVAAQTAAAFAHELSQPLTAIASYCKASLLKLQAENADLSTIRRALEESEKQALRAGDAIRELLDLFNVGEVATEVFDLNRELLGAVALAQSEYELEFQTKLVLEESLPQVCAKPSHLHKALLNLLHNSVEAMLEAGMPLPGMIIAVSTESDGDVARVTIRDNGPGFRQEDVAHLFEPFFTTKRNGIGMGLAISRSLIEANGGQLWADQVEGPGATFHLTLPLAG